MEARLAEHESGEGAHYTSTDRAPLTADPGRSTELRRNETLLERGQSRARVDGIDLEELMLNRPFLKFSEGYPNELLSRSK